MNNSCTRWPTFLLSKKLGAVSPQTQIGGCPGDYIGSVGSKLIRFYPAVGSGPVYWAQSGHPFFFCSPLHNGKNWEFPYMRKEQAEKEEVPYKLETI
jgi:hypothetical protein